MNSYAKLIFACISYFSTPAILAENLIDIYNLAKDNDQTLQAAYQNHKSQLESLPQAIGTFLPTIDAKTESVNHNVKYSDQINQKYNTWGYGLTITQPIFKMESWNKISQAKIQIKKAFANLANAEQSLLLRVSQQYFKVLKAEDELHFIKIEQGSMAKHLEQTKQRYKVGLTAITDVHEAQARYDSSYANVIAAENTLENVIEQLREIIGKHITKLATLKTKINLPLPNPSDVTKWVQAATEKNWKLQAARYGLIISRKEIQGARANHYPTIQLEANLGREKIFQQTLNKLTNKNIGVSLTVPIFSGGITYSKTRQAIHNYEKATREVENQYRSIESTTRQTYRNVLTKLSEIKALKQAIISNASALKATQAAFEIGNRTVVDVLDAQSYLINVEKDHAKARYDYIIQSLTLKQITGTLCVNDLQEINEWLQKH